MLASAIGGRHPIVRLRVRAMAVGRLLQAIWDLNFIGIEMQGIQLPLIKMANPYLFPIPNPPAVEPEDREVAAAGQAGEIHMPS